MTFQRAVDRIARELNHTRSLKAITEEAARLIGRPVTKNTPRTVRDALSRLDFVVRNGPSTYAPTRRALDGKSFRIRLSDEEVRRGRIRSNRLEPFFTALGKPRLFSTKGDVLPAGEDDEYTTHDEQGDIIGFIEQLLNTLDGKHGSTSQKPQPSPVGVRMKPARVTTFGLDPLGLGGHSPSVHVLRGDTDVAFDLIVRWHHESDILVAALECGAIHASPAMKREDRVLLDFVYSRLKKGYSGPFGHLLLEAYARFDTVGKIPGSPVVDAIRRDARLRVIGGDLDNPSNIDVAFALRSTESEGMHWTHERIGNAAVEAGLPQLQTDVIEGIRGHHARFIELWQKNEKRFGLVEPHEKEDVKERVVLLRKPSPSDLIDQWETSLVEEGLSERVRVRKVRNLTIFSEFIEKGDGGVGNLLDLGLPDLENFFFWTFTRHIATSRSHIMSFVLDVRDFYRFQVQCGNMIDARFADFIYAMRPMIVERFELYEGLMNVELDDDTFDELYEILFIGPIAP